MGVLVAIVAAVLVLNAAVLLVAARRAWVREYSDRVRKRRTGPELHVVPDPEETWSDREAL